MAIDVDEFLISAYFTMPTNTPNHIYWDPNFGFGETDEAASSGLTSLEIGFIIGGAVLCVGGAMFMAHHRLATSRKEGLIKGAFSGQASYSAIDSA